MNLAYRFPIIYWNCACLINDAGGEGDSTDYNKVAKALGKTINAGIKVSLVDINNSQANFIPDETNNQIWMGLKSLSNVGDDLISAIIVNRPYVSLVDFYYRIKPNKQAMIMLIKGGAFDSFYDRKEAMVQYLWITCDKKKRLTLQNMPGLIRYGLLPENTEKEVLARRIYEFNRYLKAECKYDGTYYKLDERAIDFIYDLSSQVGGIEESIISANNVFLFNVKDWDNFYQKEMDVFRDWIKENKDSILDELNTRIFIQDWEKYAKGNISSWEMEALCFYYHDHELLNVDKQKYGLVDFNSLSENPIVDRVFTRGNCSFTRYKLFKICGTCIAKDKTKSTISLLTTSGVVNVRFAKEYFSMFDRQISIRNSDGTKTVLEKSWFNRGNMIIVQGIRRGDEFVAKNYSNSNSHQLYHIDEVDTDGSLVLRSERAIGEEEEDND